MSTHCLHLKNCLFIFLISSFRCTVYYLLSCLCCLPFFISLLSSLLLSLSFLDLFCCFVHQCLLFLFIPFLFVCGLCFYFLSACHLHFCCFFCYFIFFLFLFAILTFLFFVICLSSLFLYFVLFFCLPAILISLSVWHLNISFICLPSWLIQNAVFFLSSILIFFFYVSLIVVVCLSSCFSCLPVILISLCHLICSLSVCHLQLKEMSAILI